MIDITEKGTRYMRKLLEERHHKDLTRHEVTDLAILGNIWDLRELEGGPIELPGGSLELHSSFETDIVGEILRVRPTYSRLSTIQLVRARLSIMRHEGLLEHTSAAKTTLSPKEALKEIERVSELLDQRGVQWEREAAGPSPSEEHIRRMAREDKDFSEVLDYVARQVGYDRKARDWARRIYNSEKLKPTEEVVITTPEGKKLSDEESQDFLRRLQRGTFHHPQRRAAGE